MIVGFILSWNPYVLYLGAFLSFIGAILVIIGRESFDWEHHRNVVNAVVLYILSVLTGIILLFSFITSLPSAIGSAFAIKRTFSDYLIGLPDHCVSNLIYRRGYACV